MTTVNFLLSFGHFNACLFVDKLGYIFDELSIYFIKHAFSIHICLYKHTVNDLPMLLHRKIWETLELMHPF